MRTKPAAPPPRTPFGGIQDVVDRFGPYPAAAAERVESPRMEIKPGTIPAQTVDDFGDLQLLVDRFAPTQARYNKLRDELKALIADKDPAADFIVRGNRYTVEISARATERSVDVAKAKKALGVERFLEACSVTITALGRFLAKPEVEKLLISSQTGSRKFNAVPLAAVAAAPAAVEQPARPAKARVA
jgi:hypothetical protein